VFTPFVEVDAGSNNEILHRPRNKDLTFACESTDPSRDVNRKATEIITPNLTLTGVQAEAQWQTHGCGGRQ
jgi:hypothetical protein